MTAEETIAALEVQLKQALERIDEVTEQLRVAQARIEELEKLKTPAPAFVKAEKKKPPEEQQQARKKRDAKHNRARPRSTPTQIVEHRLLHCPECQLRLGGISLARSREIIDVPAPPPVEVTEHRIYKGWCTSEQGKEAQVTRQLVEQVLEVAGPQAIGFLLADALDADGPPLAWLKYRQGMDAQVACAREPSALPGSARAGRWAAHRLDPSPVCTHARWPPAARRSGGDGGRGGDELGRLSRGGSQLRGVRCQPVGLSHPRCDDCRGSRRATQSRGEYAQGR